MRVLVMQTMDNGKITVDLDTGFCIVDASGGKAAGPLMLNCLDELRLYGDRRYRSWDLEFDHARVSEGKYVTDFPRTAILKPTEAALVLNSGMVVSTYAAAALIDA